MRGAALALLAAGALAAALPPAAAAQALPTDAPSVEQARRSIQDEIALAKRHAYRFRPLPILNATTTTTPEIEHVETGARCRFWYGSADIRFPWLDDRALACDTSRDWVSVSLALYNLAGPLRPNLDWRPAFLDAPRSLPDLVRALAQSRAEPGSEGRSVTLGEPATLTTAGGRSVDYMDYRVEGPGGGPRGTPQRHYQSFRVATIDGWLIVAGGYGPGHYRDSLDSYAATAFEQAIAAMEENARLPFFRAR
jgi:hypothetical protein